jgi:hypothetical protein
LTALTGQLSVRERSAVVSCSRPGLAALGGLSYLQAGGDDDVDPNMPKGFRSDVCDDDCDGRTIRRDVP